MGFLQTITNLFKRNSSSGPMTLEQLHAFFDTMMGEDAAYGYWTYAAISQIAYQNNVVVNKCVNDISKAVGGLTWYLMDYSDPKNPQEVLKHPLLDLLSKPNPMQSKGTFLQHLQAYKMLDGNAFCEMIGTGANGTGQIMQLWAKRPDFVQVLPGPTQLPAKYIYTPGGEGAGPPREYPVDQVTGASQLLHIHHFAPLFESMALRGLSPVTCALAQVETHNEGQRWNKNLMRNGMNPTAALTTVADLSEEQIKTLLTLLRESYQSSKNSGKPMVLTGGLDIKQLSMTPKDGDFVNLKNSAARDIAMALGVPPILLHIPGDSTYNNVKDARMAYYEETVLPEARTLRDDFNRWLVPKFGKNLKLEIDEDDISALFPRRQIKWNMVIQSNWMTTNERRREFGYPPIPGPAGDEVFVPTNQVPINTALDPDATEPPPQDDDEGDEEE